jgi:hypothetical protein
MVEGHLFVLENGSLNLGKKKFSFVQYIVFSENYKNKVQKLKDVLSTHKTEKLFLKLNFICIETFMTPQKGLHKNTVVDS